MQCAFCSFTLVQGATTCPRCGGQVADVADMAQVFTSASADAAKPDGTASSPHGSRPAADLEANLSTSLVSIDRQAVIETRLVEAQPGAKAPEPPQARGLPDSRVARGVEDSLLDIKRWLFRMGRFGRMALWSHLLVILGCVSPWYHLDGEGFTPGLEVWGWLPLAISVAAIGTLAWRHRLNTGARVAPVVLHVVLAALLVLALLWRYHEHQLIPEHLRPTLTFGFYMSAAGALVASIGALIGLSDVR